jgi:hypothetical protein
VISPLKVEDKPRGNQTHDFEPVDVLKDLDWKTACEQGTKNWNIIKKNYSSLSASMLRFKLWSFGTND